MQVLVGVDVGKTSIRVGVFRPDLTLLERWSVPSVNAEGAMDALDRQLRVFKHRFRITGTAISTFGPLSTDGNARTYGAVHHSSDAAWSGVNLPALVSAATGNTVFFDYDVNAGALAEKTIGAARLASSFVYLSIGTGIGGAVCRGKPTPGYAPQLGHIYLPKEPDDQLFPGSCRFHGGCLQGLASGRAIAERWGVAGQLLPPDHRAWDLEARYLARACANLIYLFSPERIVVGSSVSAVEKLLERTNDYLFPLLNGFLEPELHQLYLRVPPVQRATLAPDSSLIGAAIMAKEEVGLKFSTERLTA